MSVEMVTSADGTTIAFERQGSGPTVVLIGGAFNDRSTMTVLAGELAAAGCTTVAFDRRGRGESDEKSPYAVEREIEDVAAVAAAVGGPLGLFGHSSGAVLALEVAARGVPVERLAVYEPPFVVAGGPARPVDLRDRILERLAAGDRDAAVELFLVEGAATPPEMVAGMRQDPVWGWFTALAHTLPQDLAVVGPGGELGGDRYVGITAPTLAIGGGTSPEWLRDGAREVAAQIPGARYVTLDGQDHNVLNNAAALRPLLETFYA
ncbi:alpha/beta fold hydrolase [Pseudonocardia sp. TRM90224]|uniref:alpha/beta fold hydrolase n=1 Tax=Pseudonocardia sp. TRM90224 TaxID=2812678 RepID=UPI001E54A311|nr:alpha/beta hydrolase [Pseudonocardia sp. TRM90224]